MSGREGRRSDKAMDAVLDQLEASTDAAKQDDPANDTTLSPFFCSPINKDTVDIDDDREAEWPREPSLSPRLN